MISFNQYQQNKKINVLASECFNSLCDIGIDPNNFLEWLAKKDFQVNETEISKFVKNNSLNEAGVPPKPTPLQTAMKDPARKAMVQRALQSLKTLQGHLANSIKRGGLLGKQPDFNKILNQVINTVSTIKENVNEAFGQTVDALASGAMGAVGGFLSGGFKGMARGAKSAYHGSLDQGEINAMKDVKDNLDTLINSLPDKNAPIVKQLQAFNAKIQPLIEPAAMAQAQQPQAGGEQQNQKVGTVETVNNELLKALETIKAGKEPELDMIKDKDAKQQLVIMLKESLPIADGKEIEDGGVKYTFKDGKWFAPSPYAGLGGPSLQEADAAKQQDLNAKYPPTGKSVDEFWKELQNLVKAEKVGKIANAMSNLHNRLQKIKQIPDKLRNYLIQLLQGKNESVYYTMDYSDYVSDLIKG